MEKITRLDLMQVDGYRINIRLTTDTIVDGEVLKSAHHRLVLSPSTDVAKEFEAINSSLIQSNIPPLDEASILNILSFSNSYYTDAMKAEWANRPQESVA